MDDLTPTKFDSLAQCEDTISRNLDYFLEAGRALMVIRENFKAWGLKDEHGTFETYCRAKWGMAASRARQLIGAAETVTQLESVTNVTPSNEGQARALAAAPPEKRAEVWQEAVETAPEGKVTAKHIKEVVVRVVEPTRPIETPVKPYTGTRWAAAREAANTLASHLQSPPNQWSPIEIRNWMRTLNNTLF